jgi:hypothetical protein
MRIEEALAFLQRAVHAANSTLEWLPKFYILPPGSGKNEF